MLFEIVFFSPISTSILRALIRTHDLPVADGVLKFRFVVAVLRRMHKNNMALIENTNYSDTRYSILVSFVRHMTPDKATPGYATKAGK